MRGYAGKRLNPHIFQRGRRVMPTSSHTVIPHFWITRWRVLCIDMVSYDPRTRTVYASDAANPLALLDAVLHIERSCQK